MGFHRVKGSLIALAGAVAIFSVGELVTTSALAMPTQTLAAAFGNSYITQIELRGNQRIEKQTIYSYLGIREGIPYSQYDVDQALKNLFATGFFADVKITPEKINANQTKLVVTVIESPIISRIAFEGNSSIEDSALETEVELKPRSVFSRTKIQSDVKRILDLYRRAGRFSAQVEPKVIPLDENRVDLVFEINEGQVTGVQKITFIGNEAFSESALREVIRTSETRWYKFFTSDDQYDPDRLLFDQELLRRHYVSNGYADFQVKSAIAELTPKRDAFYITFTVEEGSVYKFGEVGVSTSLPGTSQEEMGAQLQTKAGEIYNASLIEDSIDKMVDTLGDRGFAFVDITPQFNRHPDTRTIDIDYQVKEGPRVYVERINIEGNSRTLDEVVRREFRIAEGDPYSTSKLARSEQRINNLGFFEKVKITNEPGSAPDRTVINVEVEEKSTGELSLGAGYSTADGALADVGIRETNLLGRGQDLRFKAMLATERQQFDIGFTEPYFLDRELAAGFDLFRTTQDFRTESSFDRKSTGGALRMGYALTEKLQHQINYSLRETEITDVTSNASRFIRDQEGKTVTSMVGQAFIYDDRDSKFDPSKGYFIRLDQEVAGAGGDAHFIRHQLKGGYYYPIIPKWIAQFAAEGGHVAGLGEDVRINDRFFVGDRNLRGFDTAGIGPRDILTDDALGGNMYYTATAELRFPLGLPEELGFTGSVFTDAGNLWNVDDTGPEVVDSNTVRASVGAGIAWNSPFGPIRVDLAKAVVKEDEDSTQVVHFNFGTRF